MPPGAVPLARELTGHLKCVRCGYDLRGLSVLNQCPECGLNVRTTLLAKVDPRADELQPILCPLLTAIGLVLWPAGALGAAAIVWTLRSRDVAAVLTNYEPTIAWAPRAAALCVLISGVGALALIRPHRVQAAWVTLTALGAVALYPVLAWLLRGTLEMDTPVLSKPYLQPGGVSTGRIVFSLVGLAAMALIALGLRASQHRLVIRSVLMRTGRIDRQAVPGILGAIAMAAAGQVIHLVCFQLGPDVADVARWVGTMLVAVGSMLLTLGLVGLFVDSVRLWPVVTSAPLSLRDVLGTPGQGAGRQQST